MTIYNLTALVLLAGRGVIKELVQQTGLSLGPQNRAIIVSSPEPKTESLYAAQDGLELTRVDQVGLQFKV